MGKSSGSDREREDDDRNAPGPRPSVMFFAAAFVAIMAFNLWRHGSDSVTIFLGTSALLTLGVDVGKMIGRR